MIAPAGLLGKLNGGQADDNFSSMEQKKPQEKLPVPIKPSDESLRIETKRPNGRHGKLEDSCRMHWRTEQMTAGYKRNSAGEPTDQNRGNLLSEPRWYKRKTGGAQMIAYVYQISTKEITDVIAGSYEYVMESAYVLMCNFDGLAMTLESEELTETDQTNYTREQEVSSC